VTSAEATSMIVQWGGLLVSPITIGIAAFVSKGVADRSIEKHKALLGQETERLKGELSKETESHKFSLRKKEILFGKEMDAASAYFDLYAKLEPRYSHPDKGAAEVIEEALENFGSMSSKISGYLAVHGVFLSEENRKDLEDVEQTSAWHQYTHTGRGDFTEADSSLQAERVLKVLKIVRGRFVDELRS